MNRYNVAPINTPRTTNRRRRFEFAPPVGAICLTTNCGAKAEYIAITDAYGVSISRHAKCVDCARLWAQKWELELLEVIR